MLLFTPLIQYLLTATVLLAGLVYYTTYHSPVSVSVAFTNNRYAHGAHIFSPGIASRLSPNVPPKIWQIWLEILENSPDYLKDSMHSFVKMSAGHAYTAVDGPSALDLLTKLSATRKHAEMLNLYQAMPRRVLRADFLRYVILAIEGGLYSDVDTTMLRPMHEWVPIEYKSLAKLIVGLEVDDAGGNAIWDPNGPSYPVQFCMWTIASSAEHPVLWAMIDRILAAMRERPADAAVSDEDILRISGPQGWSRVVYQGLSDAVGRDVNYTELRGLKKPVLYGDILILPIEAFGADFGDQGQAERAFVRHGQAASWRGGADTIS